MRKVTVKVNPKREVILLSDLAFEEIGKIITPGAYVGLFVWKDKSGKVLVLNLDYITVWENPHPTLEVELLAPGEKVVVEYFNKEEEEK